MATGTVIKVDVGNRKFALGEKVTILKETLKKYRVQSENGTTGWIDKQYIALGSGETGVTNPAKPKPKPPRPKSKPKPIKPKFKPKLIKPMSEPKPVTTAPKQNPIKRVSKGPPKDVVRKPAHKPLMTRPNPFKLELLHTIDWLEVKNGLVPYSFRNDDCSGICNVDWDVMQILLPSYGIKDAKEIQKVGRWMEKNMKNPNFQLNSVPAVIESALGRDGRARATEAKKYVAKVNNAKSPKAPSPKFVKCANLERADGRNYDQIKQSEGFHGWGGDMSLLHAQKWAQEFWENLNSTQKYDWLRRWKGSTRAEKDAMPFVATGWTSQKGGNTFKISVPLTLTMPQKNTAELQYNGSTIEDSTIICIVGEGEILFLTGIPMKYISKK